MLARGDNAVQNQEAQPQSSKQSKKQQRSITTTTKFANADSTTIPVISKQVTSNFNYHPFSLASNQSLNFKLSTTL